MSNTPIDVEQQLQRLSLHQQTILNQLDEVGNSDYLIQYHPDLSPVGWHIGHCVYTETYWVQET